MKFLLLALLLLGSCATQVKKIDDNKDLIYWGSQDSEYLIERAIKTDFYSLANFFETQSNRIYCGPTSATIVLNAFRLAKNIAPIDEEVLMSKEKKYLPKGFNPGYPKYTQRSVFNFPKKGLSIKTKSKMKVLGMPDAKGKKDFGFQIRQYAKFLERHQLKVKLRVVTKDFSMEQMKSELISNLKKKGDYVLVNYKRSALGQKGGGHISPLGAFDPITQRFLIMDVNPSNAAWVWVRPETLFKAMQTMDTVENRGYVLLEDSLP